MKGLALFLSFVTAVACTPTGTDEGWEQFKIDFAKSYNTVEEESYRLSVYLDNKKIVEEHNARFAQGLETFELGINPYADMTPEEFSSKMKGLGQRKVTSGNRIHYYDPEAPQKNTVDWRTKGAVTGIKNQQQCGSCWAFSTTGSLEGQHFLKTGKLVSLSEQNLVDCSGKFGNFGCEGGLMDNAFKYIKSNGGIDTEASYPYEATDGKCRFNPNTIGATCTGYVDIQSGSEKALQDAVTKIGPISVAIDASSIKFQLYKSGVYNDPQCSSTLLDHGVLAVGYGDLDGKAYWLVKNSWGTDWGEKGYIMMSRDKNNQCGIATEASYPTV